MAQMLQDNAAYLKEQVEFYVSCNDLPKLDMTSDSDPFVVVYIRNSPTLQFKELGRTKRLKNTNNPKFKERFVLDYLFEEQQELKFDVYDSDKAGSDNLKKHDFIGSATMELGAIVHEDGQVLAKKIVKKGKPRKNKKSKMFSTVQVSLERVKGTGTSVITFQLGCSSLPKMDGMFGKADPYYEIWRLSKDGKRIAKVKGNRNEHVKKTLEPIWKKETFSSQELANNDQDRNIEFVCYDWDKNTDDDLIGTCYFTLKDLAAKKKGILLAKKGKKDGTRGALNIMSYEAVAKASFLEYLQGGAEISMMVAIDFTGSNCHPADNTSLHNIKNGPSQYQLAIRAIGNIIANYDSDQKYPVWGFGAAISGKVYHDFALNFTKNPEVSGINGIEQTYINAVNMVLNNKIHLSGPTNFQPIIAKAKNVAILQSKQPGLVYSVLLILTDGAITDMQKTKNEIVEIANSYLPLSIIIIGIGNADFSKMVELDGDDNGLCNSKGQYSKRDIVQFIQLSTTKPSDLGSKTLREIPKQFESYCEFNKLKPGNPTKPNQNNMQQFALSEADMKDNSGSGYALPNNNNMNYVPAKDPYISAPLPSGWERAYDEDGTPYYIDHLNQSTSWEHPLSPQFKNAANNDDDQKNADGWVNNF
mmetsp:Transcript_58339/g.71338  ORF Transcript_58339/g.71338 Transcript_58339/m.71338 type:complete len:644 (-) Transcript_58339:40-1971(-)